MHWTPPGVISSDTRQVFPGVSLHGRICRCVAAAILLVFFLSSGRPAHAAASESPVLSILEKRHEHVVLQHWELSCAAAALATVLRYQYGVPVTERSVALGLISREEYLANPDLVRLRQGFSFLDLKRFVEILGYEGVGLGQLGISDLIDLAPVIVPVNFNGYPHFVVFRGATNNRVLFADPAFGNVTMTRAKFVDCWIHYKDLGRVGFLVKKDGELAPPGQLLARPQDFVFLR